MKTSNVFFWLTIISWVSSFSILYYYPISPDLLLISLLAGLVFVLSATHYSEIETKSQEIKDPNQNPKT